MDGSRMGRRTTEDEVRLGVSDVCSWVESVRLYEARDQHGIRERDAKSVREPFATF